MEEPERLVFGPVPSRRLGQSMGINNIPAKKCSYSCVYCQLGKTKDPTITREAFYKPEKLIGQVKKKVNNSPSRDEHIDHLTFVPDGEPTLYINLGKELSLLKQIGIPRAIITNASLLWQEKVRQDLLEADFVSIKIDAINEELWKKINRPHKALKLKTVLDGITEFAREFNGIFVSETMLITNMNYHDEFKEIAEYLKCLNLDKSYIAIPIRPPTDGWVKAAKEETINDAFQIFSKSLGVNRVEYLIGYEGNAFGFTGNVVEDLLDITAVHPMRKEAVKYFLKKANSDWNIIEKLLREKKLIMLEYDGNLYYMRKLSSRT